MTATTIGIDMLGAALAAHDAGLCVIPSHVEAPTEADPRDRRKSPLGYWKQWQTHQPSKADVTGWFANGHPGLGYVCGTASGNLVMLELEGRAIAEGYGQQLNDAADTAGIRELLDRISDGYQELTPSNGIHVFYRISDGPVPGNLKLARRQATAEELLANPDEHIKVLIETRGEGGFTMAAPSYGAAHPTGGAWEMIAGGVSTIATITTTEHLALMALCRTLDKMPPGSTQPPPPRAERITVKRHSGTRISGGSWMSAVEDHLRATTTMRLTLEHFGWVFSHETGGYQYLRRPGKDWGVSGSINRNDRLTVFSSSVGLATHNGTGPTPTYSIVDVIAFYEHSGNREEAMRDLAKRAGITTGKDAKPPPNVDPETGEVKQAPSNLPIEFWQARCYLAKIRQAAHHRGRSADGVLGTVLARVAAQIHPSIRLPAIVGASSPLNMNIALIGKAGAGKSSGKDVAVELVPITFTEVNDDVPIGSGEGLVELFFDNVSELDPKTGKTSSTKRQTKWGMFAYLDEGQALGAMGGRQGSTLLPTIRTAWSGGVLGQANATTERRRILKKGSYALCFVVGFQLEHAVGLLDDAAGGTPQRFLFLSSNDPAVPEEPPEWPGVLDWERPASSMLGREIDVTKALRRQIRAESIAATRAEVAVDPLDAHANLVILRTAALLGILDNRMDVTAEDWELAKMIWATSCAVRTDVRLAAVAMAESKVLGRIRERVRTESAVSDSTVARALRSAARSVANRVHRETEPVKRRDLHFAMASQHRAIVSLDDAIGRAIEEGWILPYLDEFTKGKLKPT